MFFVVSFPYACCETLFINLNLLSNQWRHLPILHCHYCQVGVYVWKIFFFCNKSADHSLMMDAFYSFQTVNEPSISIFGILKPLLILNGVKAFSSVSFFTS